MSSGREPIKVAAQRCPYATLNLQGADSDTDKRQVGEHEIRDTYKRLSRLLHPDKRPPGRERDDAQEVFNELMNAYEILSDPVLRQAYDHFGHHAVTQIRNNRYDPSSLYLALTKLHQQGKTSEALEMLTTVLENGAQERRRKEWKFDADIEVNLHVNPAGSRELMDVTQTSVSFTSSVPIPRPGASSQNSYQSKGQLVDKQQKAQLAIGGRSYLDKGMGSTRGILSAFYKPSQQTFVSSDLTIGRRHLETSVSSVQHMRSGTVVSAKVSRQHSFESDKNGKLSFGFTSSRSLSFVQGRNIHAMFIINLGLISPTDIKVQYGQLSLTTWGLWAVGGTSRETVETKNEDDDNNSQGSANASTKSTKNHTIQATSNLEHPPKVTAKLVLGQFPLEISLEQDSIFDSPERSIEASISYNPFQGAFCSKGMLTRDLSQTTSMSIGVSHISMSGLTWLFRYERQELTLTIPIFVVNFLSPYYWNSMVQLSILSYLFDEVLGEMLESECKNKVDDDKLNIHETIAANEHCIVEQQQWMHSCHAKVTCSQQMMIMEHIAEAKRKHEVAMNGLVILSATYLWLPQPHYSFVEKTAIDVTLALQFWVQDSQLLLPKHSKRLLLGFYDVSPRRRPHHCHRRQQSVNKKNHSLHHDIIDYMNDFLAYFGMGQTNSQVESQLEETEMIDGSTVLMIRYRYDGMTYEIQVNDEQAVSLPCQDAFQLGTERLS